LDMGSPLELVHYNLYLISPDPHTRHGDIPTRLTSTPCVGDSLCCLQGLCRVALGDPSQQHIYCIAPTCKDYAGLSVVWS
jgi:hypothetical protein